MDMSNTTNRAPLISEHEEVDGSSADRKAIDEIKEWVINFTTNRWARISMDDVYRDKCLQPRDGDMYDAFAELVAEGVLEGPDPYKHFGHSHSDYKYRRLPRVGDFATYQVGSDSYAYTIVSVAKSGKSFEIDMPSGCTFHNNERKTTTVRRASDGRWYTKGGKKRGCLVYPGLNKPHLDPHF